MVRPNLLATYEGLKITIEQIKIWYLNSSWPRKRRRGNEFEIQYFPQIRLPSSPASRYCIVAYFSKNSKKGGRAQSDAMKGNTLPRINWKLDFYIYQQTKKRTKKGFRRCGEGCSPKKKPEIRFRK